MLNFDARVKNSDAAQLLVTNVKTPISWGTGMSPFLMLLCCLHFCRAAYLRLLLIDRFMTPRKSENEYPGAESAGSRTGRAVHGVVAPLESQRVSQRRAWAGAWAGTRTGTGPETGAWAGAGAGAEAETAGMMPAAGQAGEDGAFSVSQRVALREVGDVEAAATAAETMGLGVAGVGSGRAAENHVVSPVSQCSSEQTLLPSHDDNHI